MFLFDHVFLGLLACGIVLTELREESDVLHSNHVDIINDIFTTDRPLTDANISVDILKKTVDVGVGRCSYS